MAPIIGIDLGTTNSVVAILDGREPRVLINEEGQRVTPSVVAFQDDGHVVAGAVARRQAITNPLRTISSAKRFIGQRYDEVAEEAGRMSYEVVEADNGDAAIVVDGRRYSPPEIAARILQKLRRAAEQALGEEITQAVITVPAYFNDAQRQATRHAGEIAGLEVKRIINEPTAAALAYGLGREGDDQTVAVYDFGGGTFDISILDVASDVVEVRSTAGDTHLGGDDVDRLIVERLQAQFLDDSGIDVAGDRMVRQRLRDAAERAKIELSSAPMTEIHLPFLASGDDGPKHLTMSLTRAALEQMIAKLVGRTIACCERALEDAGLTTDDIDEVLLVGGSTRIPLVQGRVAQFFGRDASRAVNPDEAVALGAAVQGGILGGADVDILLLDVTPLSLGVETRGGLFTRLIERNTTIPTRATKEFSTAGDNQKVVRVHVLQGERQLARDNRSLGTFELGGIPPMPRGHAKVEVTFDIDANGIVSVNAVETTTGKSAEITIQDAGGIADDEIGKMVADAERSEEADLHQRIQIERRNVLEASVDRIGARAFPYRDELPEHVVTMLDGALDKAREFLVFTDVPVERYDEMNNELLEAAHHLEDAILGIDSRRAQRDGGDASSADEEPAKS